MNSTHTLWWAHTEMGGADTEEFQPMSWEEQTSALQPQSSYQGLPSIKQKPDTFTYQMKCQPMNIYFAHIWILSRCKAIWIIAHDIK